MKTNWFSAQVLRAPEGDDGSAGTTTVPTPTPTPAPSWFAGLDADTQAYITSKGLADKDAATAFVEAAKSHRSAEQFIGAPADQLIRLPKENDAESQNTFWNRLGRPADATGYDFTTVKRGDGAALEANDAEFYGKLAHSLNLPKEAGARLAAEITARGETAAAERTRADQAATETEFNALKSEWGANFDTNRIFAERAFTALAQAANIAPEAMSKAVQELSSAVGRTNALKLMMTVGRTMGEDGYVAGKPGGADGKGPMAPGEAQARLNELKTDTAWRDKLLAGDRATVDEFNRLSAYAVAA